MLLCIYDEQKPVFPFYIVTNLLFNDDTGCCSLSCIMEVPAYIIYQFTLALQFRFVRKFVGRKPVMEIFYDFRYIFFKISHILV